MKKADHTGLDPRYHQLFEGMAIEEQGFVNLSDVLETIHNRMDNAEGKKLQKWYQGKLVQQAIEDWAAPISIQEQEDLPPFPVNVLPEWMSEWASHAAQAYQVQVDLPAILVLGLYAGSIARRVRINPAPGWFEEVNLYQMIVSPPGEGKSPVFSEAKTPLAETEEALAEFMRPEIAKKIAEKVSTEEQLKHQEKALARETDPNQRAIILSECAKMRTSIYEMGQISETRLYCDDTTPERLVTLMAANDGRMIMPSSESDGLLTAIGRYGDSPNLGVLLKAWSGEECRVDRATSESTIIKKPSLNILITVQPQAAEDLLNIHGFKGRGLADRFLYSIPRLMSGKRTSRPKPIPENIKKRYEGYMAASWGIIDQGEPQTLRLSDDASLAWYEFIDWMEPKLSPDGELAPISGWANKLKSYSVRFAGIISMASQPEAKIVRKEDMEAAIEICKYYISHTYKFLSQEPKEDSIKLAMKVSSWIKRYRYTEISTKKVTKAFSNVANEIQVDKALEMLEKYNHVRLNPQADQYLNKKWTVNPLVLALYWY